MKDNYVIDYDNGSNPMSPYYKEVIDFDDEPVKKCWLRSKIVPMRACNCCKKIKKETEFVYKDKCIECFTIKDKP